MRITLIAFLVLVSCTERAVPPPVSRDDSRRVAAVQADLLAAQKQLSEEKQKNEVLTRRLADMEARLVEAAGASVAKPSAVAAPPPYTAPEVEHRQPAPVERSPKPVDNPPTWNEVAAASDFYDATNVINRDCRIQSPNDQRRFMSCVRRQQEAVSTLRLGRPFGEDEARFNEARVRCAQKSPQDYAKRVRCEARR